MKNRKQNARNTRRGNKAGMEQDRHMEQNVGGTKKVEKKDREGTRKEGNRRGREQNGQKTAKTENTVD